MWPPEVLVFKLRPTITPREPALLEKAETIEKKKTNIVRKGGLTLAACMALAEDVFAQAADPWTQAVQALQTAFTGPIATGLALVAIVVGGLMFAFGEGAAKRTLAGVIFGVGMAVGAVNFMSWLFP
jgi:type IV secretory pathway VirB2 component (pilin)